MRRTAIVPAVLAFLLFILLVSCSQMFSDNLFAAAAHPGLSASSISSMSVDQIVALTRSSYSMKELAGDSAARAAALAKLAAAYSPVAGTASSQDAALAAVAIIEQGDPDAAQLFASALNLVTGMSFSSATTPAEVAKPLLAALPSDISSQLKSGSSPPAAFVQLIQDLGAMSSAFGALSAGLSRTGGYADPGVTAADKMAAATDAAVAALVGTVQPASSGRTSTEALWAALCDPSNAADDITVDPGAVSSSSGSLAALFSAAGLSLSTGSA